MLLRIGGTRGLDYLGHETSRLLGVMKGHERLVKSRSKDNKEARKERKVILKEQWDGCELGKS
jgi:hypothetical protein